MIPFPKKFTTDDSKRKQYEMNCTIRLPDKTLALTTGWGDNEKAIVEVRRMDYGNIEFYHLQSLVQIEDQINLLDILLK